VISAELFQVFTIEELEMVLNGLPFIDTNDWEANTTYKGVYNRNHQVVKWFWEVVKTLDQEQLSKLFHFCTASTRAPVEGFR
jgi:E3 ubiquitin-protein ligase HUWE1